ncbi:3-oxoacyl-ACP reductase [Segniliparus rugosus]|uniref:Ketoreductase domain-containing protein n=1 Tax=Segniliparus rugosus (strain ATCC BAA-974 / DSM 45345 / CCUG 50838 / CIP 108380 / JCM 13579 / CDC 945) TaxID=679197 RepID=E5XRN7_SEGRC|nr:3-oxoacyl-ACP reductase [Segniliparus rugosus]EFV13000.1 hypothetical protein HMPREF9336_02159 [Segniliparus rugosus ATCC BAA-974]
MASPLGKDPISTLWTSGAGKFVTKQLGLPQPPALYRYKPGKPLLPGPVLIGGSGANGGGKLVEPLLHILRDDYELITLNRGARGADKLGALVFDATEITDPDGLVSLYQFFNANLRSLGKSGRVVVIGTTPEEAGSPVAQAVQRGLEGFTRSVAKELLAGSTAQLVYLAPGASTGLTALESTVRFLLSGKSAYVDAQVIRVGSADAKAPESWAKPLADRVAVVTGAARGIGAAIAEVFVRDGAKVIVVDVPQAADALAETAKRLGGIAVAADVTSPEAATALAEASKEFGGIDVLVNNAGITRDKLLVNMDAAKWGAVIAVNLKAPLQLANALFESGTLKDGGAVVDVASIAGIAGNRGQTNYALTKAGVIGLVDAYKSVYAQRGITINAVAPGFIETPMTGAIPLINREVGRRLNSLLQGGLPVDVAETIAYFAASSSSSVTGNVVRVCGQMTLGA